MSAPTPYNPNDFRSPFDSLQMPGAFLRTAYVTDVDPLLGTVNLRWLDHPAGRNNVFVTQIGHGMFELPAKGAVVVVGFDIGYRPYIIGYLPYGYRDLVGTPRFQGKVQVSSRDRIRRIQPGEKLLVTYHKDGSKRDTDPAITTGTEFYMSNDGGILMSNWAGEYWEFSAKENIIQQQTLNSRIITEAGVMDFGLIKRALPVPGSLTSTEEMFLNSQASRLNPGEKALTEFRLRVLETADANPATAPVVDEDPLIELVLGTKVQKQNTGVLTSYKVVTTDNTHAIAGNEITIQLKTRTDVGFEFTVDKQGNMTIKVNGDSKVVVNGKTTLECNDIRLGGSGNEKSIVLSDFIDNFNQHSHTGNGIPPSPVIKSSVTSTAVKVD